MILLFTIVYKLIIGSLQLSIKKENHRFVVIIEKEIFEKFKLLAEKEKRSASNLASKMIEDYVQKNECL